MSERKFWNVDEAASYIGVSVPKMKALCRDGQGPKHMRLSSQAPLQFRQSDIDAWIEARFEESNEPKAKKAKSNAGRKKRVAENSLGV